MTRQEMIERAGQKGTEAREKGLSINDCPYAGDKSPFRTNWIWHFENKEALDIQKAVEVKVAAQPLATSDDQPTSNALLNIKPGIKNWINKVVDYGMAYLPAGLKLTKEELFDEVSKTILASPGKATCYVSLAHAKRHWDKIYGL